MDAKENREPQKQRDHFEFYLTSGLLSITGKDPGSVPAAANADIIGARGRRQEEVTNNPILWTPSRERKEESAMFRFMTEQGFSSYDELHAWSFEHPETFWEALIAFCDIRFAKEADFVLQQPGDMTTAKWFGGSELSFPEHLLRHEGDRAAMIFRGENGTRRELSFDELKSEVAAFARGLEDAGVEADATVDQT